MKRGAIILCGGHSRRMGSDKANLPFGPETMLERVVRLVGQVAQDLVVVAAADQPLPALSDTVLIVQDEHPDRGPLEGLAAGFHALAGRADAIYATSCDVPLLIPSFIERLFELLVVADAAVPKTDDGVHPLAAVYRYEVVKAIEQMLAANRLRLTDILGEIRTRYVAPAEFADVDPHGLSLLNVNDRKEYATALTLARHLSKA